MKGIFLLFAFLFSVVSYAAPPDRPAMFNDDIIAVAPNFGNSINCQALSVNTCNVYEFSLHAVVENVSEYAVDAKPIAFVREVTKRPQTKINEVNKCTENKNYSSAIIEMDHIANKIQPLLIANNRYLCFCNSTERNLQHTNYGCPLSAG